MIFVTKFKTELHCHTSEFSYCSGQSGKDKIKQYAEAGYTTVVLTNHYNYNYTGWEDHVPFVRRFFEAGEIMRDAAPDGMTVLTGIEMRFPDTWNDYLVFGLTEEQLLTMPDVCKMHISDFHEKVNEFGGIVIQAHPFRDMMTICRFEWIDGIEVYNGGNKRRNLIYDKTAAFWAECACETKKFIVTSGSDHHNADNEICGGIITDEAIRSSEQLVSILKSGKYELIRG